MRRNRTTFCLVAAFLFLTSCSPTLLELANEKLRIGDYNAAVDLYKEYLETQPDALTPERKLGYALLKTGNAADAAVRFKRVLAEFPEDSFSTLYLGLAYLHVGERDKVLSTWKNYPSGKSSKVAAEIKKQVKFIADSEPELSDELIAAVDFAITAAVDEDRSRNAYNLWRLGDCG